MQLLPLEAKTSTKEDVRYYANHDLNLYKISVLRLRCHDFIDILYDARTYTLLPLLFFSGTLDTLVSYR